MILIRFDLIILLKRQVYKALMCFYCQFAYDFIFIKVKFSIFPLFQIEINVLNIGFMIFIFDYYYYVLILQYASHFYII